MRNGTQAGSRVDATTTDPTGGSKAAIGAGEQKHTTSALAARQRRARHSSSPAWFGQRHAEPGQVAADLEDRGHIEHSARTVLFTSLGDDALNVALRRADRQAPQP